MVTPQGPADKNGMGICSMWGDGEEVVARIALISAAPEMYAMLQAHIAAWENLYPSDVNDVDDINIGEFEAIHGFINKTKSLLAKVRGESNE